MITALVCIFLISFVGRFAQGRLSTTLPYIYSASLFAAFVYFSSHILGIAQPHWSSIGWSQEFGVRFSFVLDGLSLTFALLISGIGSGVFLYAASYMKDYKQTSGFFSTLLIFTGSMLGLVLSDNLVLSFIFWELTSITSFLLIAFKYEKEQVRESARTALFVTAGGGLLLLVGIVLISLVGQSFGLTLEESLTISRLNQIDLTGHALFPAIIACIAIAVATKSAQVPLHFWLPLAMAGPTPVSSFLHSATMVKAGVFLLARLHPALGNSPLWTDVFMPMGALTMILGAVLAASQRDIKKILAYSTVSVLGTLTMLLGIGTEISIKAAVVYIVAHALYKASLFQIIGNIDFTTQNRDIKTLSNLGRIMPLTAAAAFLSSLSMAGAPPLFGFFGKELAYFSKLDLGPAGFVLMAVAVLANILIVGLALSICFRPFWRSQPLSSTTHYRKLPISMALVPLTLSVIGCFVGIFPKFFDQYLGTSMASAIYGGSLPMKLKLWHGVNPESLTVLALSAFTILAGVFIATRIRWTILVLSRVNRSASILSVTSMYQKLLNFSLFVATKITQWIQNGRLKSYLRITIIAVLALMLYPFLNLLNLNFDWQPSVLVFLLGAFIGIPVMLSLFFPGRMTQVALVATSGLALVVTFSLFSAVDLAITQLMVESLSVIFIFFLIRSLSPARKKLPRNYLDLVISLSVSCLIVGLITFKAAELPTSVSDYFINNSFAQAFGKNIVNVILVDFRALDTFGEVVVVSIASLGVGILLSGRLQGSRK